MFEKIIKLGEKRINQLGMHRYKKLAHYENILFCFRKCNTFIKGNYFFIVWWVINHQIQIFVQIQILFNTTKTLFICFFVFLFLY